MRVSVSPSLVSDSLDALSILTLSDLHLTVKPEATRLLHDDEEFLKRMDYIVLLGDQMPAWGTDEEYAAVDEFIAQLPRLYSAIYGNHEFFFEVIYDESLPAGRVFNQASPEFKAQRLEKFRNFYGYEKLWRAQSTPLGVFIFLCLEDVNHPRPEALSTPQQEFLEDQIRNAQSEPVYVFCHAPLSLGKRLDLIYYEETRTACVELMPILREWFQSRSAPVLWVSGHIHLRPDHYLYPAYEIADRVWQVHCPDGIGYSRWAREQIKPEMHDELYSRSLEISRNKVALVTRDHVGREDIARQDIEF